MKQTFLGRFSPLFLLLLSLMSTGAYFVPVAVDVPVLNPAHNVIDGLPVVLEDALVVSEDSKSLWVEDLNGLYKSRRLFAISS
ncbi:MAG: hypothetical protein H6757_02085 [Candidatus Omnitrophica bacterium]|nr:hypothetical protein [Candidatus Omnitrophota bacterium]